MSITKSALDISDLVFVYGTLKNGHGNNKLLETSEFIGEAKTERKCIMAKGNIGIPYVFPSNMTPEKYHKFLYPVKGELFRVSDPVVLGSLDLLEGHPKHYTRTLVNTANGESAWMYLILERIEEYLRFTDLTLCKVRDEAYVY